MNNPGHSYLAHGGEAAYLDLLSAIRHHGLARDDRTGVGSYSLFGATIRWDLRRGFPLLTTKRVPLRLIAAELAWFIQGGRNIAFLHERNCHIWDDWADENGDLGPVYGAQWRSWPTPDGERIDQLARVVEGLRRSPHSRRHVISAWNVADLDRMALAPCHVLYQFFVADGELSCLLYQRSADLPVGVPFNAPSAALLTYLLAHEVGLAPGDLIHSLGDVHIYQNQIDAVDEQLARSRVTDPVPQLRLSPVYPGLFSFDDQHVWVEGYDPHPKIAMPVAV